MDVLFDFILTLSKWSRLHLHDIALAIMATALVLFGPIINTWARRTVGHLNFAIRIIAFAALCILGFGLALIYLTPLLASTLAHLNNYTLAPVLLMIFILVGVLADRN
ncbi:DUF3392 domain-containing protein [Denitrificimonas caeni]|uniref:DUF3392 domain-containing protein n=1 Tax=Denitrificimonas caeni TaxID=521720 RepID=UPI001962A3E7|nr:DUF3392 domain-containing protein [Denitrificimonas caeni]